MKSKVLTIVLLFLFISAFAQIKVACVGNSITYGSGIEGRDSLAYPPQLGKILGKGWIVKNFGVGGATMLKKGDKPYWEQPEFKKAKDFLPDVVIIKLGTNDSKPQNWDTYSGEFQQNYKDMIESFQTLMSHPKVFIGIPIPVVEERWGIRKNIVEKDIPVILKQLAEDFHLKTINFYKGFIGKYDLLPDKIHPNAQGARIMAKIAAKVLKKNKRKIRKRK